MPKLNAEIPCPPAHRPCTPRTAQLATVVEALGAAGASDADFYRAVGDRVAAKAGDFAAPQLAKLLAGAAAAGAPAGALAKAAAGALAARAGEAGAKDLAQAAWALAKLRRCASRRWGRGGKRPGLQGARAQALILTLSLSVSVSTPDPH